MATSSQDTLLKKKKYVKIDRYLLKTVQNAWKTERKLLSAE